MRWATLHAEFWGVSFRYVGKGDQFEYRDPGRDPVLLRYGL